MADQLSMLPYPKAFLAVMEQTFHWEGGVANVEHDKGGLTNMGITKPFLSQYLGRPATDDDIVHLTREAALDAYYKLVWEGFRITHYPDFLRLELFNAYTGSTWLGNVCTKRLQEGTGLFPDGIVGPKSVAQFRRMDDWPQDEKLMFNQKFVALMIEELIGICERDPTQIKFMRGWFRRYNSFLNTVNDQTSK